MFFIHLWIFVINQIIWKFRREISGHWPENFCNSHIFSQTISQKMIFLFAIIFRQCLQNCFRRRRGEKKTFFPGLSVFFKKNSGHWVETLMQSGKLFRQFHQNCFLRALFKIFVKKTFCVMFHQSSFLDICWKKVVVLAERCWRSLCLYHLWQNCFVCFQKSVSVIFSQECKKSFHFCKFKRKVSVLWYRFSTGLSKLQSFCPQEQFEESRFPEKTFQPFL